VLTPESTPGDLRRLILEWYDGYSWDGETRVLNPWSILNAFYNNMFGDYWSRTGGLPSFLANLVKTGLVNFKAFKAEEAITDMMNAIELGEKLKPIPILFQSGYLTVDRVDETDGVAQYGLRIPNLEVKAGLLPLLMSLEPVYNPLEAKTEADNMLKSLNERDAAGFQDAFGAFLSQVPYSAQENQEPSPKAPEAKMKALEASERYYHTIFQAAMIMAGAEVKTEVSADDGAIGDYCRAPDGTRYIFVIKRCPLDRPNELKATEEDWLKMRQMAEAALSQIEGRKRARRLLGTGHDIYKVALVVGRRTEVLAEFKKEELS
jgi:hypothetical protein